MNTLDNALSHHMAVCERLTGLPAQKFEAQNVCFTAEIPADGSVTHHSFLVDRHIQVLAGKIKIALVSGIRHLTEKEAYTVPAGHPHKISSEDGGKIQYWFASAAASAS